MSNWLFIMILLGGLALTPCWASNSNDPLTPNERAWLAQHPIIRVAPDPDYPPVEFIDSAGHYRGIAADTLNLLAQKLNIEFKIVKLDNWDEVLRQAKAREVDVLSAAAPTPQRREYMIFTQTMVEFPGVIIVREEVSRNLSLNNLRGMQVAIVSGYVWQDQLANNYPDIHLKLVPDVATGLRKVSFGLVDAMVENLAIASYNIEREGISNLRVAGESGYQADLALAVRNDWPELASILNKGLSLIQPQERANILSRWVRLSMEPSAQQKFLWRSAMFALGLAILTAALILGWNRSLRAQVNQRTEALRQVGNQLELRVRKRTAELEASNAKLKDEMNARRRMEEDLWRFRATLDQTLDCVFMFAADTLQFIYVNQGAIDQVRYRREELLNMTPLEITPNYTVERFRELLQPMLEGQQASTKFETMHRAKDGSEVPVEVFIQYVTLENSAPLFIAIVRDVTERHKVDRLKSEFISTVSHELRTPLTAIHGALRMLAAGVAGALPEQASELIQVAARNSERLSVLVNDILDLERLEVGKLVLHKEVLSLTELVEKSVQDNHAYAQKFAVHYHFDSPAERFLVCVDQMRIAQVLSNLLSNAAKFSHPGGSVEVRVKLATALDFTRVEVEDHGVGISEHYRPHVFEKFTQDDTSDTRASYGSGLGLHISKGIIDRHNGRIGFTSEVGTGSCFYIELPLHTPSSGVA